MIVSQSGTAYDTSDGSEQPHAASAPPRDHGAGSAADRWADDGASPTVAPAVLGPKPAWSVLSLRDVTEARRLSALAEPRLAAERAEQASRAADQARADRADAAGRADRDRHRNAWENT